MSNLLKCRFCNKKLTHVFVDLGSSPLANSYIRFEDLSKSEVFYPLKVYVCDHCFLVQLPNTKKSEEIFSEYAYFSSYSTTWLKHAEEYVEYITARLAVGTESQVIEVASNDGYLLQYFKPKGIKILGIDPARNVAQEAIKKGIPTLVEFFGVDLAKKLVRRNIKADLIIGNNILAHVPNINDFVYGMKIVLKPRGTITIEFPHLSRLVESNQFDTIYHEHYSYFSFITANKIFRKHGLKIYDVEEIPTHGGSLRIYVTHLENSDLRVSKKAKGLLKREKMLGFETLDIYSKFQEKIDKVKFSLLKFLIKKREDGKLVVGYGAPAKGNTFLNYAGIMKDLLSYTVDRSPHKQGHFLPGTRIPIYSPEKIFKDQPDYLLILPWNIKDEIMEQMKEIRSWGGRFVIAIPELKEYE